MARPLRRAFCCAPSCSAPASRPPGRNAPGSAWPDVGGAGTVSVKDYAALLKENQELRTKIDEAAQQEGEQARFAAAVGADERQALPGLDGGTGSAEQQFAAPAQVDVAENDHRLADFTRSG